MAEEDEPFSLVEGAKTRVVVNAYERNATARTECLKVHGRDCAVCGLDFGQKYGPVAEGYIQVHHLLPLSQIEPSHTVDPKNYLRPVCPNRHAVIQRRNPPFALEDVRDILASGATFKLA